MFIAGTVNPVMQEMNKFVAEFAFFGFLVKIQFLKFNKRNKKLLAKDIRSFLEERSPLVDKAVCALKDANIQTVGELVEKSRYELLLLKGVGNKMIELFSKKLKEANLKLKND